MRSGCGYGRGGCAARGVSSPPGPGTTPGRSPRPGGTWTWGPWRLRVRADLRRLCWPAHGVITQGVPFARARALGAGADCGWSRTDQEPRRRHEVLVGLARTRSCRGPVTGSADALTEAIEIGRGLDDITLVADAATRFRGIGVWHWREIGTSDPGLIAVLTECVDSLPRGALQSRALAGLAVQFTHEWRAAEAEAVGRRAVEGARAVGDDELFADIVSFRTLAIQGRPGSA